MKMPKLMAIVNITPDSFSHDGIIQTKQALDLVQHQLHEGASVIDIGAIATNPKTGTLIDATEEWNRLKEILPEAIDMVREYKAAISIDSIHPETWEKLLPLGVDIINDQSGGSETLYKMLEGTSTKAIIMHQLGLPAAKEHVFPEGVIPYKMIREWFIGQANLAERYQLTPDQLILDPGIGFGNTPQQAMHILQHLDELECGHPIMIGHSRKSFMIPYTDWQYPDYDIETLAVSSYLTSRYQLEYLRVHNVGWHRRFLSVMRACHSESMLI